MHRELTEVLNENVGFSFCLLVIMKLNYVLDLYKQNQFYL